MIKKKSKTQMTKLELVEELKQAEFKIKDLEAEIEVMHNNRIALDTRVTNQEGRGLRGSSPLTAGRLERSRSSRHPSRPSLKA